MLVDFILHKANGTDTVELNKSIDGYSVVLNPKLHDVYNQVSYVEFDVAMSMDNYIEIGDWIEVDGKKYYSLTNFASFNARIAKGGTYNVRFYSPEQWLYKANMYATNEIYSGGVYSWERVDNTIVTVGNLESFGRWLCWNTNAQQNTRMFKLGNVPTGMNEQYEVLDFNPANCLSALYSICKTYKVRYEVVPNTEASPDSQYIINFYDTDEVFPVTFKYEEENGLYKLELTGCDDEVYTQFEVAGSTENIPSSYRDTRLRLSESISALSILDYPDLYDKWGRSIKILTYENIKPTRTGTVTDIVVDDIYSFIDSSLIGATWSPVGGTIQVVEGPLMGFSFECDYFNSTNGRVHIKPMTESNGMELPSADLSYYRFTAGATPTRYNVVGIALPNEYIEDAEARLLAAAMNDTSYYSDIRASYSLAISGTLLEEGEYEINAGVLVPIQHLGIGLDRSVRVQSITYDLSKPKYYDIEEIQLSDFRQEGLMDMVTEGVRKSVATLKDVGYTNKLNTFANSVSTIKQGIAKSLGYDSWEDFMEKTWNGEDESWEPSTIIVDSLINSDLINVNTLIAREAFIGTLLADEVFIAGLPDAMPAKSLLVDENGMIDFTATTSGGAAGLYVDSTKLGYWDGTAWKTYLANNGDFYLAGASADNYLTWISNTDTLTVKGAIHALSGSIGGITIAADKVYLGDGVYGGSTTPFYVDDDGQMSLKDKFKWDGENLLINGGGTFSGALSAATGNFAGYISVGTDPNIIKIGKDAYDTGLHGIKLNDYNYWYLDGANAKFKIGGDTANVYWNGTDLTHTGGSIVGSSIDIPNATTPLFKVTSDGIITAKRGTIGGVNFTDIKLYLGTGTYGNSNTGFYVDTSAKFSLKDKLKFDGTNLTINGSGTFSGELSAATGTFSGSLSAASGTFGGLLDVGGIKIGLNAVNTGVDGLYIDTNNYWDENGNFKAGSTGSYIHWNGTTFAIKGDITGSTGTFGGVFAGTITVGETLKMGADAGGVEDFGIYIDSANYWLESGFSVGVGTSLLYLDGSTMKYSGELLAASGTFTGRVEVGDYLKIGAGVSGTNDGIFVNTYNYWYDNGTFRVGDDDNYMSFGGGSATFKGALSAATGSFSGIVEAGGIKVGLAAGGTGVDGIYIDDYNYWYDNGTFMVGDSVGNKYLSYTSGGLTITGSSITSSTFYAGSSGNSVAVSANAVSSAYAGVYITSAHGTASFGDSGSVLALQLSSSTGLTTITPDDITLNDKTTGVAGVSIMDSGAIIITNRSNKVVQISSGNIYLDSMPSVSGAFLSVDTAGFVHYGSGSKKIAIGSGSDPNTIYFSTA